MDDSFLIEQTRRGNKSAFRFLVLRYQQPVFNLLFAIVHDRAAVEELAQETFLRAYRSMGNFNPNLDAKFSTWLYTIARNLAFNETAKQKTRHRKDGLLQMEYEGTPTGADETVLQKESAAKVHEALLRLPAVYRTAVVLSFMNEHTTSEIADLEGCSEGTVKSRIFRGKEMLRHLLMPFFQKKEEI